MKRTTKYSGPSKALLLAGLLAAPMLAFNARAITYTDLTWTGANPVMDTNGVSLGYALWNDPLNWSGGNVPSLNDPATGNPDKVHFNGSTPCVIDNFAADLGALAIGDWGSGTGTVIITNGGSLSAGFVGGEWTGVAFPHGPCLLYIGTNCSAAFGSHLWVGNGTNSDGTENTGTVIVDGGTLSVTNGQLGVGWNGTGGTNYMVVTNGGKVFLRNWDNATLGMPGNNSRGQLDISTGSTVVTRGNAVSHFPGLVASGQLTSYGGAGTVSWSYDPVSNTTTLISIPPVTASTPVISAQPTNVVLTSGSTATFSVDIKNVPCNYQWLLNNQPLTDGNGISGSHTAKLTIAGVTAANVGIYSVYATNTTSSASWVLSSGASLSIEGFSFYPVITINGIPGYTYEVDYTTSLTPPVTWTPLSTVTLNGPTQFVVDSSSPMSNKRFYRVVQH
jgi:hypothetical protein